MSLARIDGALKLKCDSAVCDVVAEATGPEETKKALGDRLRADGWRFASGWHFCPAGHGSQTNQ